MTMQFTTVTGEVIRPTPEEVEKAYGLAHHEPAAQKARELRAAAEERRHQRDGHGAWALDQDAASFARMAHREACRRLVALRVGGVIY